jgi:hypothetical protein
MKRRAFVRFFAGLGILALPAAALLPRLTRRRVVEAVRSTAFPGRVVSLRLPLGRGTNLAG